MYFIRIFRINTNLVKTTTLAESGGEWELWFKKGKTRSQLSSKTLTKNPSLNYVMCFKPETNDHFTA